MDAGSANSDGGASARDGGGETDATDAGSTTPWSSRDKALVYSGNGAIPPRSGRYLIESIEDLTSTLTAAGLDVMETDVLPGDLDTYRLLFWYCPAAALDSPSRIDAATIAAIGSYIEGGGRLVVTGETNFPAYEGYEGQRSNDALDAMFAELGIPIRLNGELDGMLSCAEPAHPLMESVEGLSYDLANELSVASPAAWLQCSTAAAHPMGRGDVVVLGDLHPVSTWAGTHERFILNLASVSPSVR